MILLRIKGVMGGCKLMGGSEIEEKYKYHVSDVGWFPIDSVSFGFQSKTESNVGNSPSGGGRNPGGGPPSGQASSAPNASANGGNPLGTGGSDSSSNVNITKAVDVATTTLMTFAMSDRKKTKGRKEKNSEEMRQADIHFLDSVSASEKQGERFVFPYMMIHLQNVQVKNWNINAQGDDRPNETMELWYDKVAIKYYKTTDGKVWSGGVPTGWDQTEDDIWTPGGEAEYFNKQPHL